MLRPLFAETSKYSMPFSRWNLIIFGVTTRGSTSALLPHTIEVDIYSSPDATPVVNTVWPQIIQYMKATIPQIEPFLHHPSADKWALQKNAR